MAAKKPVKKESKNPKGELVSESVEFELTDSEITQIAESTAAKSAEVKDLRMKLKETSADFKAKIKLAQTELDENLVKISLGTEEREVECIKVLNKDSGMTEFWYMGELKKERETTDQDRQKAMPFLRKKGEAAAKMSIEESVDEDFKLGPKFKGKFDSKMAAAGDASL